MKARIVLAVAAMVGGTVAGLAVRRGRTSDVTAPDPERWYTVTVDLPPEAIDREHLPTPLHDLDALVDVRVTPAPGRRGTQLSARMRLPDPPTGIEAVAARFTGSDPRRAIRLALREAKQLLEVGEIIRQEPQPAGRRSATPAGKLIDVLAKRSSGEGVL
jgi:hypothetical protein